MYIYYTCICIEYASMYIYIYIYREREREREVYTHIHMCVYMCVYIYIYIYIHIHVQEGGAGARRAARPRGCGGSAPASDQDNIIQFTVPQYRAVPFMPMPMSQPVCRTSFNNKWVQYEVRGMGMNLTVLSSWNFFGQGYGYEH